MSKKPKDAEEILAQCERLYGDTSLTEVRRWKEKNPGRPAIGHLPVYVPPEVIDAAGGLPVAISGGGDQVDVIKGDACFQSYICHIPRSTVELGLTGELDVLDGMVFPSTCDVIRNLSGIWQMQFPKKYTRYLDLPQTFTASTGGCFYMEDLEHLAADLAQLGGRPAGRAELTASIQRYNANRRAIAKLYALRSEAPWLVGSDEAFLLVRAGSQLEVTEHTELLEAFLAAAPARRRRKEDRIRVILVGSFCEQPPLGLLRTLDRSGLYVVDDDLNLGARFILGDIEPGERPMGALVDAYLTRSTWASTKYEDKDYRDRLLVKRARELEVDGVVFAAASFCDPALLDQPTLQKTLTNENIPFISFKYAENTGQFQGIREQAGTFSDSIKLWGNS